MASIIDEYVYDVFLSFRGEDTRYGFTGNLKKALVDKGVRTFMDDVELQKGDEITPSLLNAIESSKIAIVVLSKNYAASSFCLQELSKILDSMKVKCVLPVFYKVEPSDVRKLEKTYGEAIAKHKVSSNPNTDKWKASLHQVADLSGFHYKKGELYEYEFIGTIVEEVLRKIKLVALPVGDFLVGLEPQKEHVTSLLNIGSDDEVNMLGIHGIGGIGKTTLALAVYNLISHQFQVSCFLEKVRENSDKNGLIYLQKILLSQIVGDKNIEITSVRQGISVFQQRLNQKKVLLLLDDVDNEEQLQAIVGKSDWFGLGSRVIITTRDKRLLTCHGVERTYEVKGLNNKDAFELLRWKAFKSEKTNKDLSGYVQVLERAVAYASGLPLALEVIGSHFFKRTIEECKCSLDQCERVLDKKIQVTLQLSFDALEKEEKSVFLDIACCLKGYKLTTVERILHSHHGYSIKNHINVLVEKSLIKISESGNVTLHDLIEDMGKDIVRQESPDPGERSRLWASKDINEVLKENKGTSKIEIIYLDGWIKIERDGEAFKKMENLKTLIINGGFDGNFKHLPNSLRVVDWHCRSPFQSYPRTSNQFENVDFLKNSRSPRDWYRTGTFNPFAKVDFLNKKFQNMRILNLDYDRLQIPDLSNLPNLEELSIQNCWNIFTIDISVGFLSNLKILRIINCKYVKSVPPLDCPSLVELDLSYCFSLESFPLTVNGFVGNLKILRLEKCSNIRIIPLHMLHSLEELNLNDCTSLESFSHVVGLGEKLKTMSFRSCINLISIPPLKLTSLEKLDLSDCTSLHNFPLVVDGFLGKLKTMRLENCHNIKSIPPLKLDSLETLDLAYCYRLESFLVGVDEYLLNLKNLFATNCQNLRCIPRLKLDSLKTLDLSHCYSLESFPGAVDGLLENIEYLNIERCIMLKSIPSLRVTSLKEFNLSHCLSLQSFPEILGEMTNTTEIHLDNTPIKELPFPFQSLIPPQTLRPMKSSHVEYLSLCDSKLSDEYWAISFMLFANLKELHLANNQFTVLPKSMEKCHFLRRLVLDDCVELQEIKGIPPCLKVLSALNCQSLTLSSKSKLLNQKLHEAGNTCFLLPRAKIPEWFDHQFSAGLSISFWFRNKFPAMVLCVVSPLTWCFHITVLRVIINGDTFFYTPDLNARRPRPDTYHLHLFHMKMENFKDTMDKALLENKWNHAEVDFGFPFMYSGIHVLKDKSSIEDFQLTNPEI
ncbi:disease resistance protein RUN1-like [Trifolium pratense]|uniref:disease resistance protein RUN1-like n=1 Tax=Trifolium pratense TaxID=57577 RepID=UPI001E694BA1|nr:disease resistance protein RUN1-like [Trifolium pratense]